MGGRGELKGQKVAWPKAEDNEVLAWKSERAEVVDKQSDLWGVRFEAV